MRLAVLTGGGDCPGLNAAIRAIVHAADRPGDRIFGVSEGWKGLLEGRIFPLSAEETAGLLALGGTVLGTSRVNPFKTKDWKKRSTALFRLRKLDGLIAIGGEGTLKVAASYQEAGMPVICIPKTIDNDTWGTDSTIGFQTAVQIATEAIDRLQTTAEAHRRVMIVEVMGRHAGWIATHAGIAGGAHAILTPEEVFDLRDLERIIERRALSQRLFSIVVAAEDARIRLENGGILKTPLKKDEYGDVKLGGIGELLAGELRKRTDSEVRVTVLGHVQRGGTPTAFDRVLATRLGVFAVDMARKKEFGRMAVLRGDRIESIPLRESVGRLKTVPSDLVRVGRCFFR